MSRVGIVFRYLSKKKKLQEFIPEVENKTMNRLSPLEGSI